MLNSFARELRDTLLRRIPNTLDHPKMNMREWAFSTFTRYLELENPDRNAYVELLDECIAHVQGGFPFRKNLKKDRAVRQRMLFEFIRADLLFPRKSGTYLFAELEPFRLLKQMIEEFDTFVEGKASRLFSRLDLREHEHNDGYDLVEVLQTKEVQIKELYAGKLTTRLMKLLIEHDGKELPFANIYRLLKIKGKGDRRIRQLIAELKIDAGIRKERYVQFRGDSLFFRSSYWEPKKK